LLGFAVALVAGVVAGFGDGNTARSRQWRFGHNAIGGALAIGVFSATAWACIGAWIDTGVGGVTSVIYGLAGAVMGGLVGGVAGGPGFRGRHIVLIESTRWSTTNAVRAGLEGLLFGLGVGILGGGLVIGVAAWMGIPGLVPMGTQSLNTIVGGPVEAVE